MCPLVRTTASSVAAATAGGVLGKASGDTCIDRAIQALSFDPSLQDAAWYKAQARAKARPYHNLHHQQHTRPHAHTHTNKQHASPQTAASASTTAESRTRRSFETDVSDVFEELGLAIDPVTISMASTNLDGRLVDQLAHKHLYIPQPGSKRPRTCAEYLRANPGANRIRLLAEYAACLQYLHSHKIVHDAIRPDSLFVDDEGSALLSYQPAASSPSQKRSSIGANNGNARDAYTAPELSQYYSSPNSSQESVITTGSIFNGTLRHVIIPQQLKKDPTPESDVFAFGSIMHWLCTGSDPSIDSSWSSPSTRSSSPSMAAPFASSSSAGPASSSAFPLPSHSKQFLMELTDYSLTSLIRQCRSSNPSKRPKMMMIVMQLQQMLVRHVVSGLGSRVGTDVARKMICSGPLPLPSSPAASISQPSSLELALQKDPMSAPLSSYLPKRKKATTSSPIVEQRRENYRDEQQFSYQVASRVDSTHFQEVDYTRTMPALVPATASYATYGSTSLPTDTSRLSSSLPATSSFPIHDTRYGPAHVPQVVFQPPTPLPRDTTKGYMQPSETDAWMSATNSWEAPSGGYERRRMSNAGLIVPAYYGGALDDPWSGSGRGAAGMYHTNTR